MERRWTSMKRKKKKKKSHGLTVFKRRNFNAATVSQHARTDATAAAAFALLVRRGNNESRCVKVNDRIFASEATISLR
jgi:hypothetical protein